MTVTSSDANRILDLADDIDAKGEKGIAQQLRNVAWALRTRLTPSTKEALEMEAGE